MMRYLRVTSPDLNNGNGVRCTLWIAGCTHKCKGCHNSWTWSYNQGQPLNQCIDEIREQLDKQYIKGITISGGDPLDQSADDLNELYELLKLIKTEYPEKDIWIYTGYYYNELNSNQLHVLSMCDTLIDGPYIEEQRDTTLAFRGSCNQNIISLTNNENN